VAGASKSNTTKSVIVGSHEALIEEQRAFRMILLQLFVYWLFLVAATGHSGEMKPCHKFVNIEISLNLVYFQEFESCLSTLGRVP
jgi:hypothetical protein